MVEPTKALFIRVPEADARRLAQACERRGMTKTAFVAAAVRQQLEGNPTPGDPGSSRGSDEVLTLDELANLLKLEVGALRARVERGEIPGRRFDDEWRFARSGILDWLSATDTPDRRAAGFDAGR